MVICAGGLLPATAMQGRSGSAVCVPSLTHTLVTLNGTLCCHGKEQQQQQLIPSMVFAQLQNFLAVIWQLLKEKSLLACLLPGATQEPSAPPHSCCQNCMMADYQLVSCCC